MNGKALKKVLKDVETMMVAFQQHVRHTPTIKVDLSEKVLREALIKEECAELIHAIEDNDLDKIADGVADVIVVVLGTAVSYGIPVDTVWDEVMRTNMEKTTGPKDPKTGKRLKPLGWKPPDIKALLKQAGWNKDE